MGAGGEYDRNRMRVLSIHTGPVQPNRYARIGGALYLVIIVAGILAPLLIFDPIIVPGDPDATAQNIAASSELWRLGIAVGVAVHICDVPVMLILWVLLSPVNKNVASLALLFNILQTAILASSQLILVTAQLLSTHQPALSGIAIQAYSYGEAIGLAFFGFTLLADGYLIRHSDYLPWILGVLVQVAGVCYVLNGFLVLVVPGSANLALLLPSFVAELSLALWLCAKGVDAPKWELRVHGATA